MTTPELDEGRREELAEVLLRKFQTPETEWARRDLMSDALEDADALAPLVAGWVAEAEARALREAAKEAEERGDIGKDGGCEAWEWLSIRAEQAAGGER